MWFKFLVQNVNIDLLIPHIVKSRFRRKSVIQIVPHTLNQISLNLNCLPLFCIETYAYWKEYFLQYIFLFMNDKKIILIKFHFWNWIINIIFRSVFSIWTKCFIFFGFVIFLSYFIQLVHDSRVQTLCQFFHCWHINNSELKVLQKAWEIKL